MIRAVAVASLLSLLALAVYLPSAHPPERFLAQLRTEHQSIAAYWGEAPSGRILAGAMSLHDTMRQVAPVPSSLDAMSASAVGSAAAQEMASVNQRLMDNAYFRSIDALVLLAAFRLSTLTEWLPWLMVLAAAAMADGWTTRLIRAKEFRQHDPELFALYSCLAVITACAAAIGFVVPTTLHPLVIPAVPVAIGLLVGRAVSNFHLRP